MQWVPLLLWVGVALLLPQRGHAEVPVTVKVVYHIATAAPDQQYFALLNLENQLDDLRQRRQRGEIRVVLEGGGVTLVREALVQPRLQQRLLRLRRQGVLFLLERDALSELAVKPDAVAFLVKPQGVIEHPLLQLIQLERAGFAYLPYVKGEAD